MSPIHIVVLAFMLFEADAANTFRIGLTLANGCGYQDFVIAVTNGITFWRDFVSQSQSFMMNGSLYTLEVIPYIDGGEPNVAAILYEHLIVVEKVHILLSPLYPPTKSDLAFEVASTYGIPVISYADGSYPTRFPSKLKWIFTLPPKSEERSQDCLEFFKQKDMDLPFCSGAGSMVLSVGEETEEFVNDTISIAQGLGLIVTNVNSVPVIENEANDSTVAVIAKEIVSVKADVIFGGSIDELNVPFLQKVLEYGARPKAVYFWFGATLSSFRLGSGVAAINSFTSDFWTRVDRHTDPTFFPTSTDASSAFSDMYFTRFGYYPSSLEAVAAAAVEIAILAAKQAQSLDPEQLRLALVSMNISTFFAPVNFANAQQQLGIEWECYQLLQNTSGDVYETENKSLMLWPGTPPVSRCYPKIKCDPQHGKWIGVGVGIAAGLFLIAAVGGFIFLRQRYHVLVVSKSNQATTEWVNP